MKASSKSRWISFSLSVAALITCASARELAIQRSASLPASTPWNLEVLGKAPVFEWSKDGKIRSLFYQGELFQGKPTRVFACYATPGSLNGDSANNQNLPGIVLVHGGGGLAFPAWVELWASRGYAAIAMDLSGNGPDGKRLADGGPDQSDDTKFRTDVPTTDQWTYHAVANVLRAHSLLLSFPEVDPKRTVITGISWGGYLTCIVAGLDNRFKAAVPVYGCGFLHENSFWLGRFKKMSPDDRANWVNRWDPSMYVGSASMPMLFVNGGKDFAYPPDSHAKTYALVKPPKHLCFLPELKHGHNFDKPSAIEFFMRQAVEGGIPLAEIASPKTEGDRVTAETKTQTMLTRAELHYTLDALPGKSKDRKWISVPATLEEGRIKADRPPENASVWFLTAEDERQITVSSPLVFREVHEKSETSRRPHVVTEP